jgi:hypothetical protein
VHADPQGAREVLLRQSDESSERCDVLATLEDTAREAPAQARRDCAIELCVCDF